MELSLRFAELWPSLKHMRRPAPVLVEDLFLGTTDLDLQQIFAPCETPWAQPVRHAKSFLAEANTFRWVLACNHVGVAPLSPDVYATWEKARFGSLLEGLPPRRHVNQWAQRFRAKWNLRCRVLSPQAHRDPATVQAKAESMVVFLRPFSGPKNAAKPLYLISRLP